jgi:FOG: TPR repeat
MRTLLVLPVLVVLPLSMVNGQGSAPMGPTIQRQMENARGRRPEPPAGPPGNAILIDTTTDLGRGIVAELSQENRDAVKFLTKAIEQEHGNAKNLALAYRFRGLAYKHLGRREEALRDFLEVIRIDPKFDLGYYNAGVIYNRTNRYQEAVTAMSRAIELRQDDTGLARRLSERGNAYFHLGQFDEAQSDLTGAVRREPPDPDALNNAAWFRATCPDPRYRNGQEAIELATRACNLDKWKDADEIDTLAAAYAEAGNFAEAERYELKALGVMEPGEALRSKFQERLALYRAKKPFRLVSGR